MSARGILLTVSVAAIFVAAGCSSGAGASAAPAGSGAAANAPASNAPTAMAQTPATQGAAARIELSTAGVAALAADYDRRCQTETTESPVCEALRSLLVAELTLSLRQVERSKDQRVTQLALEALKVTNEPEVLIAAARVLGHFPETPNLAARITPLMLESRYLAVQKIAADVLLANPNPEPQDLGRMWIESHSGFQWDGSYAEYPPLPQRYVSMGFPKYAGSEWFSPGDSDRSIGWSTKDSAAAVAKWYGDTLHAEPLDLEKWNEVFGKQALVLSKPVLDPARMARMQQLMERLMKGEQAAQAEMEKLSKEMEEAQKVVNVAVENSIAKAAYMPATFAQGARWFIAAQKGERISKLVVVFPIPSLQRTVIREVWDLSDYPSAWPEPKKERGQ